MITFNRSQLVGAEFPDDDIIRFNGIQEDHIYGMEVSMDVRIADGEILAIQGVDEAIHQPRLSDGRAHPPERRRHLLEGRRAGTAGSCGRSGARVASTSPRSSSSAGAAWIRPGCPEQMLEALEKDPGLNQEQFVETWAERHPEIRSA